MNHATALRLAAVAIWCVPAMWAFNFMVARMAPGVIEPHGLALGRWLIVTLCLGWWGRHEIWQHRAHIRQDWRRYLVLSVFGMLICGAWVYEGARTTSAMNISLIYATSPVFICLAAVFWLKERMRWWQAVGVLLALSGVVHVVVRGQWAALSEVQWVPGDALILLAACSWATFALLQKHWPSPLSGLARLSVMAFFGCLVVLPFVLWEAALPTTPAWTWQAGAMVLVVGIFPGILAYSVYAWGQKLLGASRVSMVLYLGPLWGAVVSWGVLDEPLGWHHLVGAMLILPGVALAQFASGTEKLGSDSN
jgi:drug/metabolite transporter (DMT)-like permease